MTTDIEGEVIGVLSNFPQGLNIIKISKKLDRDLTHVKPVLIDLENKNKISSGLKKVEKGKLKFFDRYYFYSD